MSQQEHKAWQELHIAWLKAFREYKESLFKTNSQDEQKEQDKCL